MTTDSIQEVGVGLPSWFKPEKFLSQEFDADNHIKELGQYVPHDTLRSQLEKYLEGLKQKLLEVINDDYSEFVSLSNRLSGVEGAVIRMKKPMMELKARLQDTEATIQQQLTDLKSCLQRRKEIAAAREMLELMLDAAHVLAKVEKLLQQDQNTSQPPSSQSLSSRCGLLERVASEMSRLNFYTSHGSHLAFLNETTDRRKTVQIQIRDILEPSLIETLQGSHGEALGRCLHAAVLLGEIGCVEKVVKTVVVREIVEKELQEKIKVDSVESCRLANILPELGVKLQEGLKLLLKAIHDSTDSHRSLEQKLDIGGRCVLPELDASLQKRAQSSWSPGMPDQFLENYNALNKFISQLAGISDADEVKLRSSESCQQLLGRWNLSVYFSLRFRQIVGSCQEAIPTEELKFSESPSTQHPQGLCLSVTYQVVQCLVRCFDDKVYLTALAHRFLTLSLQLCTRYSSWLREASGRGDPGKLDEVPVWARSSTHEDIVIVANDALILGEYVNNDYVHHVVLPRLSEQVQEVVVEAYNGVILQLQGVVEEILTPVITFLCDKSNPLLQQMKGIAAMYRMTAREPPSKPSGYVSKVFKTLELFLGNNKVFNSKLARQIIIRGVVDGLTKRFNHLAQEHLGAIQKSEESLKRLKKPGQQTENSSNEMSNLDKIALQFFLDVKEHGKQIQAQGVNPAQLQSYQDLWKTVAPNDQKQNITI